VGVNSVLSLAFALLAGYLAAFHGWLFWKRRSEPAHLWLAVTAAGMAVLTFAQGMALAGETTEAIDPWLRVQFAASAPIAIGFVRFSWLLFRIERPLVDRAILLIAPLGAVLVLTTPWVIGAPPLDPSWPGSAPDHLGQVFLVAYAALVAYVIALYAKNLRRIPEHQNVIRLSVAVLCLCSVNDILVGAGAYTAPYLISIGYTGFVVGSSTILIHRFVRSAELLEQSAENLQQLVDERTDELHRKELQLAHGERLATLGTLAASVAHEINNPTAYVTSNLNQLDEMLKDDEDIDPSEMREIVTDCQEGTGRIQEIVSDLLSLARRGDGSDDEVDLRAVVEGAIPIVRRAALGTEVVTELRRVPAVRGDPRQLGQVVVNLALNGIQACEAESMKRGQVSIETSFDDGSIWLIVRDTGPGIPAEVLPHIFDPFVTTKLEGEGTGLGLAVTHQIVTRHRGRIDVDTSEHGTCMIVELPPADAAKS
jgi:signal transduction histidine kinase